MTSEPLIVRGGWAHTGLARGELMGMKSFMSDPILVESLDAVQTAMKDLRDAERSLVQEITARLHERGGTQMVCGKVRAVLDSSTEWVFDIERLADLQSYIEEDLWERAAPLTPAVRKPNKTVLNSIAKRGGVFKEIVDAGCSEVPKTPKIKIIK